MAEDTIFSDHNIPFCPTTAQNLPHSIITWEDAKAIYKKNISVKSDFKYDAFVCFYIDDYKFDGPHGIWHDAKHALVVINHFSGVITPDFSTYQDFPEPLKIYATYRMRLIGFWLGRNGACNEEGYEKNPILFGDSSHNGLLPKESFNKYPVGNCAEVDAVNQALNAGADINHLHLTVIHATKNQFGRYKESCENCKFAFKGKVKENYSGWIKEE